MKRTTSWLTAATVVQFLTALMHSLSLIQTPVATNSSEQQLFKLMHHYRFDFGMGFERSTNDLMQAFSISFLLFLLFSATVNCWLILSKAPVKMLRGISLINVLFYFICTIVMWQFTFLLPVLFLAVITLFLTIAFLRFRKAE